MTRYKWLGLLYSNRSNFALKWLKIGSKWVKNYFSHFSQFLARKGAFFLASREKSKTREMCMSSGALTSSTTALMKVTLAFI